MEEQEDIWSQRLRSLDRIGGLGLSALILFGLYRLVTFQLAAYNGLLDEVAESQNSVALSQEIMVDHMEDVTMYLKTATDNQLRIVRAIEARNLCVGVRTTTAGND